MPLQILIATLLALVTLGTQLPEKQKQNDEVTIMGSNKGAAEVIKSDGSDIIVITTLKRRSHHVTIMGVQHHGSATHTPATTAWRINEKNKQHKRNAIARAA